MADHPHEPKYSDKVLKELRRRLTWTRERLASDVDALAAEAMKPAPQDSSVDHLADFGTDNWEQEIDLELLEDESNALQEIDDALSRIDGEGEYRYGLCEVCADTPQHACRTCPWIKVERLRYVPWARNCVKIQEAIERGEEFGAE